jgi:hypothetical protein
MRLATFGQVAVTAVVEDGFGADFIPEVPIRTESARSMPA